MIGTLKITSPILTAYYTEIEPLTVAFGGDLNEPMSMTFTMPANFDEYEDDTASTNPLQLRSAVTYTRNSICDFDGFIINITKTQDESSEFPQQYRVECVDKLGAIKQCAAVLSGDPIKTTTTTVTTRTEQTMLPLVAGSTSYYPDPADTALYLAMTGTPQTVHTSAASIGAGAASITTLSTLTLRMRTKGLLDLGTGNYASYDGYDSNGTVYVFSNVIRGILGGADDALGVTNIYQLVPKRIDPTVAVVVEGQVSPTWIVIDPSLYTVDYENGSIEFETDPSVAYPDGIRATYVTYDEDDADALILGGDNTYGMIDLLLLEDKANGGPGLASGQINIDIPRVVLPSVTLTGQNCLDAIAQLLEERYADGVTYNALELELRPVAYWWSSPDDEFVIDQLNPAASIADTIRECAAVSEERALADAFSGVIVKWTTDLEPNAKFIQVASTVGTSGTINNVDVYTKFRSTGFPVVAVLDCGECSEGTALTTARNYLAKSWTLAYAHTYVLNELPDTLPVRGKRYAMPDGLSGRCISVSYTAEKGNESMTMTVVDLTQEIN